MNSYPSATSNTVGRPLFHSFYIIIYNVLATIFDKVVGIRLVMLTSDYFNYKAIQVSV